LTELLKKPSAPCNHFNLNLNNKDIL